MYTFQSRVGLTASYLEEQMRIVFKLGMVVLPLGILASSGFAAIVANPTCVTNNSSTGWVLAGLNGGACLIATASSADPLLPATFVLPEGGSETALEPVGDFTFNKAFSGPNGYFTIMDVTGGISDYILVGNTSGGLGELFFYSDPAAPTMQVLGNYKLISTACNEGASTGCLGSFSLGFTDGSAIAVTVGSDGNAGTFDPFRSGLNTSDGIQFTVVPEPSTWMMGAGLLLIAAGLARRRNRA
jgi:hypothetical protein